MARHKVKYTEIVLYPNCKAAIQESLFGNDCSVYVYDNDGNRSLVMSGNKKQAEAMLEDIQNGIRAANSANAKHTIYA